MKKQEIYIIPGFGETIKDDPYPKLSDFLKDKGYLVKNYQPKWRYGTITQWLKDFDNLLLNDKNSKPIVLGFSLGANIAILKARDFNFSKIILCSLSPFFKEDLKKVSPLAQRILGKKRINEFKKNEFPNYLKTLCIFISGSLEKESHARNTEDFFKDYSGRKEIYIIPNVGHDISNSNYLDKIESLF